jgi:hypothetical protein
MSILGVLLIACLVTFFGGVMTAGAPSYEFKGWPAVISFLGMCSTGLVLAVHAL